MLNRPKMIHPIAPLKPHDITTASDIWGGFCGVTNRDFDLFVTYLDHDAPRTLDGHAHLLPPYPKLSQLVSKARHNDVTHAAALWLWNSSWRSKVGDTPGSVSHCC